MIALRIDFIAGRYHATPWNRAVNEGDVEWPPSPWRILRAISAGWFQAPTFGRGRLSRLCDRLAEPPRYLLPPTSFGHTRHYMPQGSLKGGRSETTLILDAFVKFDSSDVASAYVVWDDVVLDAEQLDDLRHVSSQIGYLGRAESWCRISALDLVPPLECYIEVALASAAAGDGPTVQRLAAGAGIRGDGLLRSIFETSAEMRRSGRRMPNGTVWLDYRFPDNFHFAPAPWFEPTLQRSSEPRLERFLLEAVRPRGLRPSITDTVRIAGLMRAAAMQKYSAIHSGQAAPTVLSGREAGEPARGHAHAFFIPRDLDRDGRIDHVDVWLPAGGAPGVLLALRSIEWLSSALPDGRYAVINLGAAAPERAAAWQSVTPFVPALHLKRRALRAGPEAQREWARDQVLRELRNHRHVEPVEITIWEQRPPTIDHRGGGRTRFDVFVQSRKPDAERARAFGVTLRFAEPQRGPILLGRESHYGLGQFLPAG